MAEEQQIIVKGVVGGIVGAVFCRDDRHSWDFVGVLGPCEVRRCTKCSSVGVFYTAPASTPGKTGL